MEDFSENYVGLRLHYTYLSHKGFIWGRMVFRNSKIIVYNPTENCADEEPIDGNTIVIENKLLDEKMEHAYRSTVMHECCHGIYHYSYYCLRNQHSIVRPPYTSCGVKNIIGPDCVSGRLQDDIDWIEHQAKYFSAAILMPRTPMFKICKSQYIKFGIFENNTGSENDALAAYIAKLFNVSCESAKIRVKQLGLGYKTKPRNSGNFFSFGNLSTDSRF